MDSKHYQAEMAAFADHLHQRRLGVLDAWSKAAQSDPQLTAAWALSRAQFYDHIPGMLDALEDLLRATAPGEKRAAAREEAANAEGHGLRRWQQGYDEDEVMREWAWLHECIADEVERYAADRRLDSNVASSIWRQTSTFVVTGMTESVGQYVSLQRADAAARLQALEGAHRQLGELERKRAEAWREAAHDLRGNLSIVHNVAQVLQASGAKSPKLAKPLHVLERSIALLIALIDDLTTQARLDAGREQRDIAPFDAAQTLAELCASSQAIAADHGLYLKAEGPPALRVEGDRVKVGRIAQNLLLNALQYTKSGGIKVSWNEVHVGAARWSLCVQDTGPGLAPATNAPLSAALDAATRDMNAISEGAEQAGLGHEDPGRAPTLASHSSARTNGTGEGIGLAIVKRLCELLDATLELETEPGKGTTFRVTFPRKYPDAAEPRPWDRMAR